MTAESRSTQVPTLSPANTVDEKATSNPYLTPFLYGNITFDDIMDQNLRRHANLTLQQSRTLTNQRLGLTKQHPPNRQ